MIGLETDRPIPNNYVIFLFGKQKQNALFGQENVAVKVKTVCDKSASCK